jgi:hypothetical protein
MRKYLIKICTPHETALQTCIASNAHAAWDTAWNLCEKLLGTDTLPSMISVRVQP